MLGINSLGPFVVPMGDLTPGHTQTVKDVNILASSCDQGLRWWTWPRGHIATWLSPMSPTPCWDVSILYLLGATLHLADLWHVLGRNNVLMPPAHGKNQKDNTYLKETRWTKLFSKPSNDGVRAMHLLRFPTSRDSGCHLSS